MAEKLVTESRGTLTATVALDSSLATHHVVAATVVHEAWVDCIAIVAIASITPLADTFALQERIISILKSYQSILIYYPKKGLKI